MLNDRAFINCVTSPAPHNRITHYPSLAQHPIQRLFLDTPSVPHSTLCLRSRFLTIKSAPNSSFASSLTTVSRRVERIQPSQRKFPLDFMWLVGLRADAVSFTCCHIDCETSYFREGKSTFNQLHRVFYDSRYGTLISCHHSVHFDSGACGFLILTFPSSTPMVLNYLVVFSTQHTQHRVARAQQQHK